MKSLCRLVGCSKRQSDGFGPASKFYPQMASAMALAVALCVSNVAIGQSSSSPATEAGQTDGASTGPPRPNIVWIMSEDNSADYLRHFDPMGAPAPNIEAMANHGITFDHAFSNAPVCSVARTTLITSCYGPRIGTQFHRRIELAKLASGMQMFPAYLRQAGYYTTNQSKEDYNATPSRGVWDDSSKRASWKNRPGDDTPFFHVQTDAASHEGRLHFPESDVTQKATVTDPQSVQLQPYFPDTPLMRYTRARYQDQMMVIDDGVGRIIRELDAAGQLENTFVFYFGDHGGVLPGSKGYTFESGLHVPLVVRVPRQFADKVGRSLGSRTDGFVQFVDFGPTVLSLAGIQPPAFVDGKAFLGDSVDPAEVDARDEAFGYADRFDEKYDLVRTLRKGNFKYVRNFEAFYPDGMQNNYRYQMAAYRQWRSLYQAGKLNEVQSQFFRPKSVESLYDLDVDPFETHNLAGDPAHAAKLLELRSRLMDRLKGMPDLSFVPEAKLVEQAMNDPVAFGQSHQEYIAELIDVANLALLPFADAQDRLRKAIASDDAATRYWGVIAATALGDPAASLTDDVADRLQDSDPLVVARAVEFMAVVGGQDARASLYGALAKATTDAEALQILGTAVFLRDHTDGRFPIEIDKIKLMFDPPAKGEVQRRLDYLGS
ncbi:Sulfatase [Rubripirellula lacrimiformis]|uniref:Sulfatase n=1 Tax=Rubripirellula lacrimiformis TaxID=1930273 RepID=A0A517NJ49_9BACT|nr:sulfatase-like hydrolase/transferase [Rubripirellula lacrimiformis]QDT07155.1 Sulfatase [Rubripirellula lacrimiformis]